jgi:hypothetical protein
MLKTVLAIAALTFAQVIQLSVAHAGGGYPGSNTAGQTPTHVFPGDTGLPAHHNGGDVKPPKPQSAILNVNRCSPLAALGCFGATY